MPGPLDQLKAYFASGGSGTDASPYAPWQRTLQSGFEGGMEGLKGLVGAGDDTTANKIGQLVGAVAPFGRAIGEVPQGVHPAVQALLNMLSKAAEPAEAGLTSFGDFRAGAGYIPHRSIPNIPAGFELPGEMGTDKFIARDPALAERYAAQRTNAATGGTMEDMTRYGRIPRQTDVKPSPAAKMFKSAPAGFESKFSLSPADQAALEAFGNTALWNPKK